MAKPHKTTDQAAAQITRGDNSWASHLDRPVSLTWAFRSSIPEGFESSEDSNEGDTFARMNAVEREATREALDRYADVAEIKFRQVSDNGSPDGFSNGATLLFSTYDNPDDGAAAFAYFPGEEPFSGDRSAGSIDGDFWYNRGGSGAKPRPGDYDYQTFLHEIGHSLGLDHPGDYDAAPGVDITYANSAEYAEDTLQYTNMSYFEASDSRNGADHSYRNALGDYVTAYATTLMIDDIAAIQRLYGANTTTRHGTTIYGFHSNASEDGYGITGAKQAVFCIYDTGGTDTLDLSGYKSNQLIDLEAGSFSNAGLLKKNISIAQGVVVERALGGGGNDTIFGNDADNRIDGRSGRDTITGGDGADVLIGGAGADRFVFEVKGDSTVSGSGRDTIIDFRTSQHDRIDLSDLRGPAFHFIGDEAFGREAGELRAKISGVNTLVSGDIDGNGAADFSILLKGHVALDKGDFVL